MNIIELKKAIYNFLTIISKNVFDSQAPSAVQYPYIVYTLENSETDENQKMEIFELVIDIYDNKQFDRTAIDTLAGQIDGDGAITNATGLHRKHYYSSVLRAEFYRVSRDIINETEKNISHIELTYDVYAYLT